jgi:hypothetical protein
MADFVTLIQSEEAAEEGQFAEHERHIDELQEHLLRLLPRDAPETRRVMACLFELRTDLTFLRYCDQHIRRLVVTAQFYSLN